MRAPKRMRLPEIGKADLGTHTPLGRHLVELNECLQIGYAALRDELCANAKTGTLILDDGANWRVTMTFYDGKLTSVATAASTAALAQWTDG
ncbi:MAG: hypothetical protein OEV33_00065 [Armatimonadota bacterium]|nr:hypothetical protein [Armatimonadota bacterium]